MSASVALLLIVASVAANAFFAGVETGITSARRIPLLHRGRRGHRPSRWGARLLRRREDGIIAAVVGNNLTIVAGTAIATAFLVQEIGPSGETVAAIVMTAINAVFGEILPKAIYRARPERLLVWSAPLFLLLYAALTPVRWAAVGFARLAMRLVGQDLTPGHQLLTRDRMLAIFQRSALSQDIEASQQQLVGKLIHNTQIPLADVMTPLDRVRRLRFDATVADAVVLVRDTGHSRVPLVDPAGEIRGLVIFRDLIQARPEDTLSLYERGVLYVPETMGLDEAILVLIEQRASLAVVVDGLDRGRGILTLEDLLEPLVGQIVDEHDATELSPASGVA